MKKMSIKDVRNKHLHLNNKEVFLSGWVKSFRSGKENSFLILNDGSCFESVQIFFPPSFKQKEKLNILKFGSGISIEGILKITQGREQNFEIIAKRIIDALPISKDYPFQKKNLPISLVREYPQFRARTNYFLAMFKLKSEVSKLINIFFQKEQFIYVNTPILTSNDAEGGGESFSINKAEFFNKRANLTVSGQLHVESLAQGLGRVYNFSPCFRAEMSNTTRHLSEFWMIEAEAVSFDLRKIIKLTEKLIKYVISGILKNNISELQYFEKYNKTQIVIELEEVIKNKFPRISYSECIKVLNKKYEANNNFFKFNEIFWGMNLKSEHEKYLTDYFKSPIFVINYPVELKAFYMKENTNKKTVSCMDLLFPRVGELIGGSAREDDYTKLKAKLRKVQIDKRDLDWYLELRRNGYLASSGFGMGLERLLMFLSKSENIKDTIPFPRYYKYLNF